MALLAAQQIKITGTNPTFVAAAGGGDTFSPGADDRCFLQVKNASGGSINVTVVVPGAQFGQNLTDAVVAVGALTTRMIPLTLDLVDPATGLISWTYSATTSVTVAVIRT